MAFWQIFFALSGLTAVFLLWPVVFVGKRQKQALRLDARTESNAEVFQQHIEDLERTRSRGEIAGGQFEQLKRDLEQTMIEENNAAVFQSENPITASFTSRIPVLSLIVAIPLVALLIYFQLGARADWEIHRLAEQRMQAEADERAQLTVKLVAALQARVRSKPQNSQNWYLLAATSIEQGNFEEAVRAYRVLQSLEPGSALIKAELAQALFLRAGRTMTPEVRRFTQAALQQEPQQSTALGLAGIDAFQAGSYREAINYWQAAVVQLAPNSNASQVLSAGIARAQAALGAQGEGAAAAVGGETEAGGAAATAPASLEVNVAVDQSKVSAAGDAVVFIYARAWQGPPMPLAIRKVSVADLPIKVTLDQSMAMTQGMDLASFPQVEVVARISSSGSAITRAGDWQATAGPVIVAAQKGAIELTISEQIP